MRFGMIGLFWLWLFPFRLHAQPILFAKPLSPRIANYDLEVTLDVKNHMLRGKEILTWYNRSPDLINELQFHLYLNAFRNSESTFMKELIECQPWLMMFGFDETEPDRWGFIEVNRITTSTGEELKDRMEFIHPDDDNQRDKTVFRLPLPRPLLPEEFIVLHIEFTAKLPQPPLMRTGAKEEYFFIAQWYPKIGVYLDGRWNCHQFHAHSEFFADFGVYNVRITVPEQNLVGATGLEVELKGNQDGTKTHFYHAEDVHDFAWTTSPEFVAFEGMSQDVSIRVLMQPDHVQQGPRHVEAAQAAVKYFQDWYGDYPYPNLTVVDPRRGAGASGGMEYPTLITAGTSYDLPEGVRTVEQVIIHEFGHNYWYHLLASNEFEESWLDEGVNSYTEIQIMSDRYGPKGDLVDFLGIQIDDLQLARGMYLFFDDLDPVMRSSWNYYSCVSYFVNSYAKPALVLTTLHNLIGKEVLQQALRTYAERWRFKHPKTKDFIDVVNEVAGQDLSWFFDQALFSNAVLDYSVDRVFTRMLKRGEGYDFTLSVAGEGDQTNKPIDVESEPAMYYSEVGIRRLGDFKFPVEVELRFENGEAMREKWDGKELWKKIRYTKPTKLISATVDPDGKIPLDINSGNNSRTVRKQYLGTNRLAVQSLFWVQLLLEQPEFLNLFSKFQIEF